MDKKKNGPCIRSDFIDECKKEKKKRKKKVKLLIRCSKEFNGKKFDFG